MPLIGVAEFVGGMTVGRFVDTFGRSPGLMIGATAGVCALYLTYVGNSALVNYCTEHHPEKDLPCEEYDDYSVFYGAAVLYGFMDVCIQVRSRTAAVSK